MTARVIDGRAFRSGERRVAWAATALLLLPVWVAAIRSGVDGIIPIGDTAIMAIRAPQVLQWPPPLIGMPASSASAGAHVVHFPGALQLYWLAVPVTLLGPTWGTVVGMGLLNSIWIVLLVRMFLRNLEYGQALWTMAMVAVLIWSLGSGMLIESRPLDMVIVPFLVVIVAALFTSLADRRSLVVLVIAANYLWLSHLVLALSVPLLVIAGLAGLGFRLRASSREDPDGHQTRVRALTRTSLIALGISVVMWAPTILDQIISEPGNLGLLFARSDAAPKAIRSWSDSVHVVSSLVMHPPFWLRGSISDPTFYRSGGARVIGSITWFDLATVLVVVLGFFVLVRGARRRSDELMTHLVGIAAVTVVACGITAFLAPQTTAVVPEYFLSFWAAAMVVWLTFILGWLRLKRPRFPKVSRWAAVVVLVVFVVLTIPASSTGYGGDRSEIAVSKAMIHAVVPRIPKGTTVAVSMADPWNGNADYLSALLLALDASGRRFCFPRPNTSLYTFIPDCSSATRPSIVVADGAGGGSIAGIEIFDRRVHASQIDDRVNVLQARLATWLRGQRRLEVSRGALRPFLGPMIATMTSDGISAFKPVDGNLEYLVNADEFWRLIIRWYTRGPDRSAELLVGCPLSSTQLYRWARARWDTSLRVTVTERSPRPQDR